MGVIFSFLSGLLMSIQPITDNDYFWHVVIGKWIDTNGAIPTKELFSWYGNYNWISHEWLTELIMYKIGPIGCIAIMLIIFLGLYYLMFKMLKFNWKKLFDFKLCYLLLMTVFFKVTGPRPYILSLLFFAYLVYVLFSYVDNNKKLFNKFIWTIPILQVIWVNFHGGSSSLPYLFIVGVLICNFVAKLLPFKENSWCVPFLDKKQIKTLLLVLGLTIIASCINPFTYKMLLYPFTNMADDNMINLILEWKSPSFHGLLGIYIFIMIVFPLFNMILTKKKFKLHEVGFLGLMLFMCLRSQRFIGMYGIYSTWVLGKYFFVTDEMYENIRKPFKKFEKIIKYCFITLLIILLCFIGYKQFKNFKLIDNHGYCTDEAVKKVIELKPERLYNDFGAGGYLLYKLDEFNALNETKIFIYGLGDVFSNNILPVSVEFVKLETDPEKIISEYNFDVIITSTTLPLHYYLNQSTNWEEVYSDEMSYIYTKKD